MLNGEYVTVSRFTRVPEWLYTPGMNSSSEGFNRFRELIEFYVILTCGAALIGWILYTAPRDVPAKAARSSTPEVRAAGSVPSPERERKTSAANP